MLRESLERHIQYQSPKDLGDNRAQSEGIETQKSVVPGNEENYTHKNRDPEVEIKQSLKKILQISKALSERVTKLESSLTTLLEEREKPKSTHIDPNTENQRPFYKAEKQYEKRIAEEKTLEKVDYVDALKRPFGSVLRSWMDYRGLSVTDLSRITGNKLSKSYISQALHGRIKNPTSDYLSALANALNIESAALILHQIPTDPNLFLQDTQPVSKTTDR